MKLVSVLLGCLYLYASSQSAGAVDHGPFAISQRADKAPSRAVWAIIYYTPEQLRPGVNPGGDPTYLNIHAALEIASDDQNSQVRIQVKIYEESGVDRYVIEMSDVLGNRSPDPIDFNPFRMNDYFRKVWPLGEKITLNNRDLVDPTTGKGVITDVWANNVDYHLLDNDCNSFIMKLATKLGLSLPKTFTPAFQRQIDFYRNIGYDTNFKNVPVSVKAQRNFKGDFDILREFDVTNSGNPVVVRSAGKVYAPISTELSNLRDQATVTFRSIKYQVQDFFRSPFACFASPQAALLEPNPFDAAPNPFQNAPASSVGDPEDLQGSDWLESQQAGSCTRKRSTSMLRRDCTIDEEQYRKLGQSESQELIVTRSKGSFNILTIFDNDAVRAAGLAAAVAAVAFIILDFVNGDFKAAALGLTSLALGVGAELAVGGPVGVLLGAAVAVLFAILPGVFDQKPAPLANNPSQILQYAFFGDQAHTGNEKCNDQRKAQGLQPNCTVVYGAGVLSKSLNWELYDAVAFLIQYNQGHAMSIPDMSSAFHVVDRTKAGDGDSQAATIDCGRLIQTIDQSHPHASAGGPQQAPSSGLPCNNPKFALKRQLITFPFVNATADTVYRRIIPAPGGDCKVLSDPSEGFSVSALNVTIRGRPVAIACGLVQDDVLAGVVNATMNYYNTTALNGTDDSLGNCSQVLSSSSPSCNISSPLLNVSSSDGSPGRAYQSAPPASPFAPLTPANATCLIALSSRLCLPTGQYATQTGEYGFASKGVSGLLLPVGGNLTIQTLGTAGPYIAKGPVTPSIQTKSYTSNTTGSPFSSDFAAKIGNVFNISLAADPSCVCLFSDIHFKGDTQCYGIGGGNITTSVPRTAKSLSVHGHVTVWIYAQTYNDKGGALITRNIEDLSQVPYGDQTISGKGRDNFSQKIVAMWIRAPQPII